MPLQDNTLSCRHWRNYLFTFLHIFVAWLNLDFGIDTCFFVGLDAYLKTWLQFLFPFYIWVIAGVIINACRYSSHLTNLIGSRAVPLLATLFLLSYMKLLRTVINATSVAVITQYPQNTSYAVWYLNGNLRYCQRPHIYLFYSGHCYSCVPVASLHTPSSVHSAFEESVSSKAAQVDQ